PQQLGSGADIDAVADHGRPPRAGMPQAHRDPVPDHDVIAEYGVAAHDDSAEVLDAKAAAYGGFARQIDPGQNLRPQFQDAVGKRKRQPEQAGPYAVAPPSEAIYPHDPQPLARPI